MVEVIRATTHSMAFLKTVGSQQEVRVPKKQTNSNWGSQNDHLGRSSTVALLHTPL